MKFSQWFLFALLATAISACGPNYVFKEYKELRSRKWYYKDSLSFQFNIIDTSKVYNLYLEVTHADTFAFENLYIMLHTKFPDGKKLDQQLSLELANKQGVWNVACSGEKCDAMIALQEGAFFNIPGEYTLTIEQFMRYEPVLGIEKIGLLIENTGVDKKSFFNTQTSSKKKNLNKR